MFNGGVLTDAQRAQAAAINNPAIVALLPLIPKANDGTGTRFVAGAPAPEPTRISAGDAAEEALFLGLRLNRGINLSTVQATSINGLTEQIRELCDLGLLEQCGDMLRLTGRGRLLSNEVFERFISTEELAEKY